MPVVDLGHGNYAIVCTRGRQQKRCYVCQRPAPVLCDYPVAANKSGTCDRACCKTHSKSVGKGRDYCAEHALMGCIVGGNLHGIGSLKETSVRVSREFIAMREAERNGVPQ